MVPFADLSRRWPRGAARGSAHALLLAGMAWLAGCVAYPPGPPPQALPALPAPAAGAPPMYFYPERGQPAETQDRDRYECYRWAVQQTGVDPGMTPVRQVQLPMPGPVQRDGAEIVAGAATGALLGAALSMPRYAGENAVIGAIFGAVLASLAQESRAQAIEQAQARQLQAAQAARRPPDDFRRAMTACMNGRGYRVG